jgi:hypothetical protein
MNIWDSVHRGLEKASHEAARIAKIQKLRNQIDGLSRQFTTQQTALINRTMELYANNQLIQSQLLPICNEMASLQQQLDQIQNELKLIQSQAAPPQPPQANTNTGTYPVVPPYPGNDPTQTLYAPPPTPDYLAYPDNTLPSTPPPPPPPDAQQPPTVSAMETLMMGTPPLTPPPPPSTPGTIRCAGCQNEVAIGLSFCPNCGKPVRESTVGHLPTMRGGSLEPFYPTGQATAPGEATGQDPVTGSPQGRIADQETIRNEPPPLAGPND